MKSNLLIKLLLLFIILPHASYAVITPTYSINSATIRNVLEKVKISSLVLINIDDTIITPKSMMFRPNSSYRGFIEELNSLAKYNSNIDTIIAKLLLQRQVMLVESDWAKFIEQLKNKGALVFGFTKTCNSYSRIKNFEQWKYEQLRGLGISFTDKINDKELFKFDNDKGSPSFYKGIIFTNSFNKTQTLKKFMSIINFLPYNVIIIENKRGELNDIDNFLKTINLDYYGIEYLAFEELKGIPNDGVVKIQKEFLLKTGNWLEDEEALKIINNQIPSR
jgi:hypothetical protein